jgi:hypothetical protein
MITLDHLRRAAIEMGSTFGPEEVGFTFEDAAVLAEELEMNFERNETAESDSHFCDRDTLIVGIGIGIIAERNRNKRLSRMN